MITGTRITPQMLVNETVRRFPATLAVFKEFGIEACCGGGVPIADAAVRDGADAERLLDALEQAAAAE